MIKKRYVDVAEGQIHCRIQTEGTGLPLILLHMTPATSESYESLMLELAGKVPTIAIDTPNYGESFRTSREPSIPYIANIILEALDALSVQRFHVFGHHTGASIALELAHAHPERTMSATLNGICSVEPAEGEELIKAYAFPNPIDARGGHIMRAWTRMLSLEPAHIDYPAEIRHRDLVAFLHAGEDWSWGYRAVFLDYVPSKMETVTRPIFFVIGRHDGAWPLHMREVERCPHFPSHVSQEHGLFYAETAASDLAPRLVAFMQKAETEHQ